MADNNSGSQTNAVFRGKTHTLCIRTPEGIAFSMPLAGPVTRALAWTVDLLCIAAFSVILNNVLMILNIVSPDLTRALYLIGYFLFSIGYGIATEWMWRGQTVGKRLFRLRVVDMQGLRLQFSQILIRNLMRMIDGIPAFYLIGGLSSVINRHAQRLGDLAANTVVVRNPEISEPDLDQLLSGKYNSLRDHPLLSARLRQRVSPQEARIALQVLLRRNELEPASRFRLCGELAAHFHAKVKFPDEAVRGITDEQYIRNVVDILYQTTSRV